MTGIGGKRLDGTSCGGEDNQALALCGKVTASLLRKAGELGLAAHSGPKSIYRYDEESIIHKELDKLYLSLGSDHLEEKEEMVQKKGSKARQKRRSKGNGNPSQSFNANCEKPRYKKRFVRIGMLLQRRSYGLESQSMIKKVGLCKQNGEGDRKKRRKSLSLWEIRRLLSRMNLRKGRRESRVILSEARKITPGAKVKGWVSDEPRVNAGRSRRRCINFGDYRKRRVQGVRA